MGYLITSFFTENTPYEEEVKYLIESIKRLGLRSHIQGIPCQGSWEKNCQYKATFLLDMMTQFEGTNIIWVDADAVFIRQPVLFDSVECDLGYHVLEKASELLSGTLFLRNCEVSQRLVKDWIALNESNNEWDQKNLQTVLKMHPKLKCSILPADYCRIFDHEEQLIVDPVIVHYQASRRYKEIINNQPKDEKVVKTLNLQEHQDRSGHTETIVRNRQWCLEMISVSRSQPINHTSVDSSLDAFV